MDLAKLVVRLEAENKALTSTLESTTRRLQGFQRSTQSITSSIKTALLSIGVGFSAVGIVRSLKSVVDQADEMGKLAQSTGVAVENLSALSYAADLSGVSSEKLGTALGRLSVNVSDVLRGIGESKEAFTALGLTADQLRGKSPDQILKRIADQFSTFEDGANKTAIAIRIFGRAGAELIPLLNQGSQGIARMEAEARSLGVVIDSDMARSAERFNDQMNALSNSFTGFKIAIAESILPSLNSFSAAMLQAVNDASGFRGFMENWKAQGSGGPFADPKAVFSITALQDQLKFLQQEYEKTQAKLKEGFSISDTGEINVPAANELYLDTLEKQITAISGRIRDLQGLQTPINSVGKELLKLNNYWQIGAISTEEYVKAVQKAAGVKVEAPEIKPPPKLTDAENDLKRLSDEIYRQNDLWQRGIIGVEDYKNAIRGAADLPKNIPGVDAIKPVDQSSQIADQLSALSDMLKSREEIEQEAYERRRTLIEQNISDEEARNAALVQLALDNSQRLVEIEQQKYAAFAEVQSNAIGLAAELLGEFAGKSKVAAVAQIGITKALAIAQTLAHTQTAAVLAYASQLVPGVPETYATAASAYKSTLALGKLSAGLIAGIGLAQAAGVVSGSSSGGGTTRGGGSTPLSDPVITPLAAKPQNVVQVYIQGDMYGWDDYIQTKVISGIRQAVDHADVVLISGTSRNGRELAG